MRYKIDFNHPDDIENFFLTSNSKSNINSKLKGIWKFEGLDLTPSFLMTFEKAKIKNNVLTIKLFKRGNWIFKNVSFFFYLLFSILETLQFAYVFVFDDLFNKANIYFSLLNYTIKIPKFLIDWTLEFDPYNINLITRKSKILGFENKYRLRQISLDNQIIDDLINNHRYSSLSYYD